MGNVENMIGYSNFLMERYSALFNPLCLLQLYNNNYNYAICSGYSSVYQMGISFWSRYLIRSLDLVWDRDPNASRSCDGGKIHRILSDFPRSPCTCGAKTLSVRWGDDAAPCLYHLELISEPWGCLPNTSRLSITGKILILLVQHVVLWRRALELLEHCSLCAKM
jgi:hypothetical protein